MKSESVGADAPGGPFVCSAPPVILSAAQRSKKDLAAGARMDPVRFFVAALLKKGRAAAPQEGTEGLAFGDGSCFPQRGKLPQCAHWG